MGCGLHHLFTDEKYYKLVHQSVGERIYNNFHKEQTTDRLKNGETKK